MIHYKVKARYAINLGTDDFQLKEVEEIFTNENPIEARREAYSHYESYLDVIEADAFEEISIMNQLLTPYVEYYNEKGEFPSNFPENLGVGLYFFSDDEELLSKGEDYFLMGWNDSAYDTEKNLELEKSIYDLNKWDTQNWVTTIKYYDLEKHTLSTIYIEDPKAVVFSEVLWTPSEFWSGSNPSAWFEDDDLDEDERAEYERVKNQLELQNGNIYEEGEVEIEKFKRKVDTQKEDNSLVSGIIKQGENRNLEFKSSLRYCLKTNEPKEYIEHSITKTISALANTEGGVLLIGVDDKGNILGLENDIKTFKSKSQDGFLKHFDNLIRDHFTEPIDAILNYGFEVVQSKLIFLVNIEKSNKPRFLITKKRGKEFYIRRAASTNGLDIEETAQYIIDKWYARD
ncbi:AlbA family DNA-binding domain-containing protein [Aequorivita sinensis]|uniref:AlbA family DNA-binding domain-containing protein n=1 Tax=Aequorivita sinensis TaxID=1382458 RepID=UPI00111F6462|nr:ATP-binding protein [Aequorivita sinensis]